MNGYVTDTMALILWMEKRKMPQKSKDVFVSASKGLVTLYIPAMALVEIGYLSEKKRIDVTGSDVMMYCQANSSYIIKALDAEIIKSAFEIQDIPELHDRLIAASGKLLGCPIITNDPKIISSRYVSSIWN